VQRGFTELAGGGPGWNPMRQDEQDAAGYPAPEDVFGGAQELLQRGASGAFRRQVVENRPE